MMKVNGGRTLVVVLFSDGDEKYFAVPANIPLEIFHNLAVSCSRGGDKLIRKVEFIDPIAQSKSAYDQPVQIIAQMVGSGKLIVYYCVEGKPRGTLPSVPEANRSASAE